MIYPLLPSPFCGTLIVTVAATPTRVENSVFLDHPARIVRRTEFAPFESLSGQQSLQTFLGLIWATVVPMSHERGSTQKSDKHKCTVPKPLVCELLKLRTPVPRMGRRSSRLGHPSINNQNGVQPDDLHTSLFSSSSKLVRNAGQSANRDMLSGDSM